MSKEVMDHVEIPVTCISPELLVESESKQITQKDDHTEPTHGELHDATSKGENCHERIVVSGGSMQMQLMDSPDNVSAADFDNVELISACAETSPIHITDERERSNLETFFPKSTHEQAVAVKERQPRIDGPELCREETSQDDMMLEQFNMTDCKVNSFFMSTSYAASTARSLQLTTQQCGIPRQLKMRTDLALGDKVRLIQVSENTGKSQRSLAAEFGISLGSVNNILRRKREYIEAFERNEVPANIKSFRRPSAPSCSTTRHPSSAGNEMDRMNALMSRWIEIAKKKNITLSASLLQDKANEFASKLCIRNFNPSGSWVSALKNQFNLQFENESTDSIGKLYTTWTKMLPYLIQGYEPQNVFTCGETTLLYKGLPDKCLVEGGICMGTHHQTDLSKHSVTILLCCSAVGEKIKPLVIGKSGVANSFLNVTIANLPVVWKSQEKASMTASLFTEWLKDLDKSMSQQNRHIALFMDMAPGHLSNLLLRNVRLQFYLDNSSSYLQPLQQGIVTSFKAHYRKRFLQTVLAWAECSDSNPLLMNNITELDVVYWIKHSWNSVKKGLIVNCFDAVGFPTPPVLEDDANEGLSPQLPELIEECGQAFKFSPMYAKVYIQFDSQIPCHVHETEPWEQQLLAEAMCGSITIKSEPGDDDFPGCRPRHSVDGFASKSRPVSQSEALESLNKLKIFASNDQHLLDTLYTTEETMLESVGNNRQQARYRATSHLFPLNVYQHGIL